MKVVLPEENKLSKKELFIYISIMIFCVVSIGVAFYVQLDSNVELKKLRMAKNEGAFGKKTDEQTEILLSEFNQIFTNTLQNEQQINVRKKESDKSIVYTVVEKKETEQNSYDVEVHIPYINVENEIVDTYNNEISKFIGETEEILSTSNKNTIYTVEYAANVKDDILSLIIRSTLKEGTNAQKVVIQTYNYDLRNNKKIQLEDIIQREGVSKNLIQEKIQEKIENRQKQVEELKNLGYDIYSRDISNDMYEIGNAIDFYMTDKSLYIVYAYGNETDTSETDVIVI